MLQNNEIAGLLRKKRGDKKAFQEHLEMKSPQALDYRLKDLSKKNNLFWEYTKFLIEQKKGE